MAPDYCHNDKGGDELNAGDATEKSIRLHSCVLFQSAHDAVDIVSSNLTMHL